MRHVYDIFYVHKSHSRKPKPDLYKPAFDLSVPDRHWLSYNKHLSCILHSCVFYWNQMKTQFNMVTFWCDVKLSWVLRNYYGVQRTSKANKSKHLPANGELLWSISVVPCSLSENNVAFNKYAYLSNTVWYVNPGDTGKPPVKMSKHLEK